MACQNQTCVAHRDWLEDARAEIRQLRAELARLERQKRDAEKRDG